eukprot:4143021-Prymnesium_polylepis.1
MMKGMRRMRASGRGHHAAAPHRLLARTGHAASVGLPCEHTKAIEPLLRACTGLLIRGASIRACYHHQAAPSGDHNRAGRRK